MNCAVAMPGCRCIIAPNSLRLVAVGPFAFERMGEAGVNTPVGLGDQVADLILRHAVGAHRFQQGETSWTQASWITAANAFSAVRRRSRKLGK